MANSRLSMRKILDVLRLSLEGGRSHRELARAINASPTTVGDLLRRAKLYGVTSAAIAETLRIATAGDYDQGLAKLNLAQRQILSLIHI